MGMTRGITHREDHARALGVRTVVDIYIYGRSQGGYVHYMTHTVAHTEGGFTYVRVSYGYNAATKIL